MAQEEAFQRVHKQPDRWNQTDRAVFRGSDIRYLGEEVPRPARSCLEPGRRNASGFGVPDGDSAGLSHGWSSQPPMASIPESVASSVLKRRPMRLRLFKLGRVFPAADSLSNVLFRLAVLRDDLVLEVLGLTQESDTFLDRGDSTCRKLYFLRRICLTLHAMQDVLKSPAINDFCKAPPSDLAKGVSQLIIDAKRGLKKAENDLGLARNKASGHLDEETFQRLLRDESDFDGLIQLGARVRDSFYRLPCLATMGAVVRPVRDRQEFDREMGSLLEMTSRLTNTAIIAVDALMLYSLRDVWR
jgi:hypothetical protein